MSEYISFLIIIISLLGYFIHQYSKQKTLKKRVSWCVTNNALQRSCLTLLEHINNIKADLKFKIVSIFCAN